MCGIKQCTMNLSDAGIEAFGLTMNCAIGTSLRKKEHQVCELYSEKGKKQQIHFFSGAYQEMSSPLIALTIFSVLCTAER